MHRRLLPIAAALMASLAISAPASANEPTIVRNVVIHNVITNPTACGSYGVTWDINIVADVFTFFDSSGARTRMAIHIHEDNTITNTVTGLTLREGPDFFTQHNYYKPGGLVLDRIVATGLQARVGNQIMDVGRVVLLPLGGGVFDLVFSAGQHPVREATDLGTIFDALPAFCGVLA